MTGHAYRYEHDDMDARERKDREHEERCLERAIQAEHEEWEREQDYQREIAWWWDE